MKLKANWIKLEEVDTDDQFSWAKNTFPQFQRGFADYKVGIFRCPYNTSKSKSAWFAGRYLAAAADDIGRLDP